MSFFTQQRQTTTTTRPVGGSRVGSTIRRPSAEEQASVAPRQQTNRPVGGSRLGSTVARRPSAEEQASVAPRQQTTRPVGTFNEPVRTGGRLGSTVARRPSAEEQASVAPRQQTNRPVGGASNRPVSTIRRPSAEDNPRVTVEPAPEPVSTTRRSRSPTRHATEATHAPTIGLSAHQFAELLGAIGGRARSPRAEHSELEAKIDILSTQVAELLREVGQLRQGHSAILTALEGMGQQTVSGSRSPTTRRRSASSGSVPARTRMSNEPAPREGSIRRSREGYVSPRSSQEQPQELPREFTPTGTELTVQQDFSREF